MYDGKIVKYLLPQVGMDPHPHSHTHKHTDTHIDLLAARVRASRVCVCVCGAQAKCKELARVFAYTPSPSPPTRYFFAFIFTRAARWGILLFKFVWAIHADFTAPCINRMVCVEVCEGERRWWRNRLGKQLPFRFAHVPCPCACVCCRMRARELIKSDVLMEHFHCGIPLR